MLLTIVPKVLSILDAGMLPCLAMLEKKEVFVKDKKFLEDCK